jgi:hypothetical protein
VPEIIRRLRPCKDESRAIASPLLGHSDERRAQ